jgi:hypothetical protein
LVLGVVVLPLLLLLPLSCFHCCEESSCCHCRCRSWHLTVSNHHYMQQPFNIENICCHVGQGEEPLILALEDLDDAEMEAKIKELEILDYAMQLEQGERLWFEIRSSLPRGGNVGGGGGGGGLTIG